MKACVFALLLLTALGWGGDTAASNSEVPDQNARNYLRRAQQALANYQFDSAAYYLSRASGYPNHIYPASIGLTRVCILQLDVQQASSYHQQAAQHYATSDADSLSYAYQLNDALIEVMSTSSMDKLTAFITQTPSRVHDLLLAYEWYIELLIEDGHLTVATQTLDKAYSLLEDYPDTLAAKFRISYLLQEAELLFQSSKIRQSISLYEEEIFPALTNHPAIWAKYLLAETYRVAGVHYELLKKLDLALNYQHQYLKLVDGFHADDYFRYGEVYQAIANIYQQLGYYSLSDEYSVKSARVYMSQAPQNDLFFARVRYSEGLIHLRQAEYQMALSKFTEVVALQSADSYIKIYKMEAMLRQMELYSKLQQYPSSQETYAQLLSYLDNFQGSSRTRNLFRITYAHLAVLEQQALSQPTADTYKKLADLIQNNVRIRETTYLSFMNDLATYLIRQNRPDSALHVTNTALNRFAKQLENPDQRFISNELNYLIKALFLKAGILQNMSVDGQIERHLTEALACYDQAISWHMLSRQGYKPLADELFSETPIDELFENAIGTAYTLFGLTKDPSYAAKAFQYSETSKSHQLFESLRRNLLIRNNRIPDSLIMDLRSLRAQTSFLKSELRKLSVKQTPGSRDSALTVAYQEILLEGGERNRQLMAYLEDNFNNYYQVNYGQPFMALDNIQQRLNTKEGMIAFFLGRKHLYSFTITKDTLLLRQTKTLSETAISSYRNILIPDSTELAIDRAFNLFLDKSKQLYDLLLGPSLAPLDVIKKLYIIPDKSLFLLPMEQLLTSTPTGTDFGNLPYLIKRYQISYGYSAAILFQPEAVADGDFSGKLLALAPSYEDHPPDAPAIRRTDDFGTAYTRLKYNQEEVAGLGKHLTGSIYTGAAATESQFYQSVKDHDVFHFAMHGLLDLDEPQYSRLVFSTDSRDSVNDQLLHNFEIYNMNIPAQMAVLSACNTGIGKVIGGEGAMSLSRAFTYAGVQSVVMTQWPADDQSSSIIMRSFYAHLGDGLPKDEALRLAKLDYLNTAHPFKKNPYYWNNFIISGKVKPLVITKSKAYLWWTAILPVFALIFLVFRLQKKPI